ncbi:PAS and ANTAR domain-containing protein [Mycolicibacterium confluentis]|uniref:histidine kinase n=1 Tax=Mycolicibacterium confluentis TaxID=28047 RepID=A0A7I7XZD0_9MYCO|nr:PAS and ANTAR domain-containing protein [Mycolicibacterium confluentis]MCV7319622.1 PAS and ANTAR domain-containing protein [Mycolicibacterium confluentis]ORV34226.1 transcription antitermination regulator [Mycolicibacterium confluentis]BBZ34646.1 putative transcription antitermination regulator [Mycolicibacterium confluentis]
MPDPSSAPDAETDALAQAAGDLSVGSFRFWFLSQRWEWSDRVARMHGYEPGTVTPTTELLLSHKHPEDRQHVQELLDKALHSGGSFSSRHRFIDTAGQEHAVLVLADRMVDDRGAVVGTEGYYVDLTPTVDQARRDALETLPGMFRSRAAIEQAKGMLMLVYRIGADQAFELLQWRSQHTNTKLRTLATQVVAAASAEDLGSDALRRRFDHLLLTAHTRTNG